jgi:hypothetical protein
MSTPPDPTTGPSAGNPPPVPAAPPATPPAADPATPPASDDPPLGPPGEKALAEWKTRAKEAERLAKEQADKLKAFEDAQKTEAEKLADRAQAAEDRAAKATRLAVASKVEALAAGRFQDPQDAVDSLKDGQVSGQGTTYNLPNYHGELFVVTPTETPFLSAIGGLQGANLTRSTEFEWQTVDRRSSTANNVALEGANAPTAAERSRANVSNVVEIHHSAIDVSYTAQAARAQMAGANIGADDNPVQDELAFQTQAELESMASTSRSRSSPASTRSRRTTRPPGRPAAS